MRTKQPVHGWLPICKEPGLSSTQVVYATRGITQATKAGHGGTLDPFSEGVLPIALGAATKALAYVLEGDKAYTAWVRFGQETDSGDLTGKTIWQTQLVPKQAELEAILAEFVGEISQIPPQFSAVHSQGERAYERARRGEDFQLAPRSVVIHRIHLDSFQEDVAVLSVECGKGTYIRALARDMGRKLGCGAHLVRLLRTKTIGFQLHQTITLETLRTAVAEHRLVDLLHPVDRVLDDIPAFRLSMENWRKVQQGQAIGLNQTDRIQGRVRLLLPDSEQLAAIGRLAAIATDSGQRICHPERLFWREE